MNMKIRPPQNIPPGMNGWRRDIEAAINELTKRLPSSGNANNSPTMTTNAIRPDTVFLTPQGTSGGTIGLYALDESGTEDIQVLGRVILQGAGFIVTLSRHDPIMRHLRSVGVDQAIFPALMLTNIPSSAASANLGIDGQGNVFFATSVRAAKADIVEVTEEDAAAVLDLQPVTFRDAGVPDGPVYLGLIAEDVAEATEGTALNALVGRDEDGQVKSVNYDRVALSLIPLVREQRERIEALEQQVAELLERVGNGNNT